MTRSERNDLVWFVARCVAEVTTPDTGTPDAVRHLLTLLRLSRRLHTLAEVECNRVLSDREAREQLRHEATVTETAKALGFGVHLSSDPRGAVVKLVLPSGYTDDWGATGLCVPTS